MTVQFFINGEPHKLDPNRIPVDTSLNSYLRTVANLTGTKSMCNEGGCGACIVSMQGLDPVTNNERIWAANSCLTPVYSCDGLNVITIEGIGDKSNGYHVAQSRLAHLNGTQCGYCSPGFAMNMYSLLESKNGKVTMEEVENSFGGNVCRCTGYRPILDAFKSLAVDATPELIEACKDIEDLPTKKCPKTGKNCLGSCNPNKKSTHLTFDTSNKEWHNICNLSDVFAILSRIGNRPYMLVSGNTAHGVFRRSKDIEVFIDVKNCSEIKGFSIQKSLEIGAGNNMTDFMDILKKAAEKSSGYSYCLEIHKHVDLIANVPVRNTGTIAGNLMIKHTHQDFPSDIFVALEAVHGLLLIAEAGGKIQLVNLTEFLKTDMTKKVITKVILPQLDAKKFKLRTFKIMKRAQNTHAFVNSGILFEFQNEEGVLESANICFGGINEKFTHASKTEAVLKGKCLFDNSTLKEAFDTLNSELSGITWELPEASPDYRKNLAIGLLYKAILSVAPESVLQNKHKSGGDLSPRPLSSGKQVFDTYESDYPMTKPVPKFEGFIQTAGEAKYANDLPTIPGELWAAFVPATSVGSKIIDINPSKALNIPGVRHFFSAKDIPGSNNNAIPKVKMFNCEVEEVFCQDEVQFHGQPAGIILADSPTLANYAAKLVEFTYEKTDKKILPTIWDVFRENATEKISKQPFELKAEKDGGEGKYKIKGRWESGAQYHYTMEPQTCVVIPTEYGLEVHSSTQWMDYVQSAISEVLNIPENRVHVIVKRIGGGYGGKITRAVIPATAAALAAYKTNRPVRFVLSMETNMKIVGKRYPCIGNYEVDVDENGKILKLNNEFWQDFGCNLNESVIFLTANWFKNCYDTTFWNYNSWAVKTNSPSNTWCRAPGILEGISMVENIMEHIAFETNKSPIQVRLANMPKDHELHKMISDLLVSSDYEARRKEVDDFNANNRWKKRGLAIVPMDYPQEFFGFLPAMVSIYHSDGTVTISHGGIEMGQGLNTKVAQVAARTLNVPLDYINFRPNDSMTAANAFCSGGSSTSDNIGMAVKRACEMILERMKPVKEENPNFTWAELTEACYDKRIDLTALYVYDCASATNYHVYGVTAAEVEIDVLTGNVQMKRVDILEDVGSSISPLMDIGQIEGAFIMGMGYWFNENIVYDSNTGELLTNRSWNYTPPGPKDIPIDFRINFLQNSVNSVFVLKSKATGEPPLSMSCVCVFALRDAIKAARKDAGLTEWFALGAPATAEQIYLKSGHKHSEYTL